MSVGCYDENDDKQGTELNTGYIAGYKVTGCPDASCPVAVSFDASDLASCFGWDPVAYPGTGWPPGAPTELSIDWCNPTLQSSCVLENLGPAIIETDRSKKCKCLPADDITDEKCCEIPVDEVELIGEQWQTGLSGDFLLGIDSCNVELAPGYDEGECELLDEALYAECTIFDAIAGVFPIAPAADYSLLIDPELSYVDISCPLGSETFALAGGGTAATGPARFMTGFVWAEPGSLGTHDLEDWHWWIDVPILMDVSSGAFTVDEDDDPLITGSGYDDEQGWTTTISIHEDATGHFYSTTWELDIEQTRLYWDVELHLEGEIEALP